MTLLKGSFLKCIPFGAIFIIVALLLAPAATLAAIGGLQNPGFEDGILNGAPKSWTVQQPVPDVAVVVGAEGPSKFATYTDMGNVTVNPAKGNSMLRLGTPKRTAEKQVVGDNTVYQDFTPDSTTLNLSFRLFSWESRGQDIFRFNLTNSTGASVGTLTPFTINMADTPVTFNTLPVQTSISMPRAAKFVDTNWVKVTITNIPQNQLLRLTYTIGGTKDNAHGTWAYFDGNTPPTISADQTAVTTNEGQTATNTGKYSDADSDPVALTASTGNVIPGATPGTWSWSNTYPDGPSQSNVTITANDGNGGVASATFTVTVNNVAPANVALSAAPPAINENDSTTISGSFTDPGTLDTHKVVIDWGDGSATTSIDLAANVLTFSASHKYLDNKSLNAPYNVSATVTDKDGGSGSGNTNVTVNNVAPANVTISAAPTTINENDSTTVSGTFTDPGTLDTHAVAIDWGDGSPVTNINLAANVLTFSASHKYLDNKTANAPYTIGATVTDKDGGSGNGSTTVTVNNVAPSNITLSAAPPAINENDSTTVSGSFTDPGTLDTHKVVIDWGDGSATTSIDLAVNVLTFSASHKYLDNKTANAPYTIGATVTDKDGGSGNGSTTVTVNNVAPSNIALSAAPPAINENDSTTVSGSFTDPGTLDTHAVAIDWGDGSPVTNLSLAANVLTFSASHKYLDNKTANAPYTIGATVTDKDGGSGNGSTTVTVNNVAPSNVALSAAPPAINENDSTTVNGSFTDPGTLDTHKVVIDWGDGSATTSIDLAANVLTFSASHKYLDNKAANAPYTIGAVVTDKDGGSGSGNTNVIVNNVAPASITLSAAPPALNENDSTTVSGSFTDPGTLDTHKVVIDWGDGSATTNIDLVANVLIFSASHKYLDNKTADAPYTIGATVTDKDGGSGNGSTTVTVNNVAPASVTVTATPPAINENDSTTVSGSFTDPGTLDTHKVVIDWGDGSTTTSIDLAANVLTFSASHKYLDNKTANAPYTIGATVTDKDGGSGNGSTTVTVNNVAPSNITLSAAPPAINENDSTTVSGSFTDPGTLDTHKVVIDWGDGSTTTSIDLAANVLIFSASHKYLDNKATNAPYTIGAVVTDKDGGIGSGNTNVIVNNVAPTATLTAPASVARRSTFNISMANPADPGTADVAAGFSYALDCGSGYGLFGTGAGATCTAVNAATTQIVKGKIQDKDGGVTEYSVNVVVFNNLPVATVGLNNTSPKTNDVLTATATKSDPDNDPVTLTFVWKKNGAAMKTTAASQALTDTYDLSVAGNGDKNDIITVEVTPNDGLDNGAMVSAQAVVINSLPVTKFVFTLGHTASPNYPNHATDPMEGSRIQFNDRSFDPDTGDTIKSWQWVIKGPLTGPNANANLINLTSAARNPYFRPPDNGVYTATLTATSSDGTSTTLTSPTQTPTITDAGGKILARRLMVVNTPPKVNALNIEVRLGDTANLFGRFLDHGWLDKHTATWKLDVVPTPIQGIVTESNTAIMATGIVTASLTSADINNALMAAGNPPLPATLLGTLTVMDIDKNSRTGTHASRSDQFKITVRADNPNINEPNNDVTTFAPPILTTGSVYFSYIQSAGDVDIFELKQPNGTLTPGSEVLVTLKGLPGDFDVALLSKLPGGVSSQGQFGTATFDVNNLKISGFDDGGFDDGGFDDGGFDDGGFDDGGFDDGGFDDGGFDDGGFDDGGFDDGGFFHGGFDDGGFDDGGFDDGGSFENSSISNMSNTGVAGSNIGGIDLQLSELGLGNILAQGYTVAGFSANRGQKDEVTLTRIAVPGTQLFVVVVGSNGARSATPYLLQIESSAPKVKVFVGRKVVDPPYPQSLLRQDSAPKTLFVTQQERLKALYNMDANAWNTLQGKLVTLASHSAVQGDILSLPSNIFDNWDTNPSSVDEANNTAVQIRNIIQTYLAGKPGIQNVVIVGSDDVVPFRRVPDETVIANERYYLRSSYLKLGSPLFSSVMLGNNLTDDYYVSIRPATWQGRELYVPELSVGRLVETPQEIAAAADAFLSVNGILSPTNAFVGGYDFFSDGSQVLASNLASGGLAVNNLVNSTWNADALRSSLLGPVAKDINAPNAHFTHYAILSAYGFATKQRDIVTTIDVKQAVDALVRRVLFTIGCHSGLSVPDRESRTVDPSLGINPALDFAQAMAQQRAIYIANTGYGLGDTDGLAGTELLLTYLAKNLVQGDITMGKALVGAKQLYLSSTSPLTVYDEKSSIQATLYGLPMYRVLVSSPPGGGSVPSGSNTLSITDGGSTTTIPYTLQPMAGANGTYYTANGDAQATAGRPVEPRIVKLLNNTGGIVHGVLLTAGSFTDTPGFDPVINRPTTEWELNPAEPQSALPSFWPAQPGTVNNLTLASSMLQSLIVTPGQFKATTVSGVPVRGIQRLYSNLSFELMRSTSNDWQPPVINSVDFRAVNDTTVAVTVNAGDSSGIARIVVIRISNGSFSPTSLVLNSPLPAIGAFTLNVPFVAGDTILVEVVDGAGNIATATGKGATFSVIKVDASADQVGAPGQPVVLRAIITGFDALTKPVSYLWDFGDGTFADGQTTVANFTVQHTYAATVKQATATIKITDAGGGVGVDKVILIFDASGDVGAISSNGDLVGGGAWIDSTSMTIVLRVAGLITDEFQYRVRIETNTGNAHLRYDGGKGTGLSSLTGSANGNQVTFKFNMADLGLHSGDTIQLYAETQDGVKATQGAGNVDRMPDSNAVVYVLY